MPKYDLPVMVRVEADTIDQAYQKLDTWMNNPRDISSLPIEVNNLFYPDYDTDNYGQLIYYTGFFTQLDGSLKENPDHHD